MKNSRSSSLLTVKCELLFQMTKQSYLYLFTLTIDFIVCNFDCKRMSLASEKLAQTITAIQGSFLKLVKTI